MTIAIAAALKMFVVFAYMVVVAYCEFLCSRLLPDCAVKRALLRKY